MIAPRSYVHSSWCDQPAVEFHAGCTAHLGTVALGHASIAVRLVRNIDTPAILTLTVAEHGHQEVLALNVERSHELDTLLRQGIGLLGRTD